MYDVITIGTATRDIFVASPFFKVLKDPDHLKQKDFPTGEAQCFNLGGKVEINEPFFSTGGGAINAAVTFRRQGFKTATVAKIGRDAAAESLIQKLKTERVDEMIIREKYASPKGKATAYSIILLAPNGERTILVYRGASEDLNESEINFRKLKSRWAYISPGGISFPLMEKIFNHFKDAKTLIAFNPSKHFIGLGLEKLKPLFNKSQVVLLNREEAAYLTGVNYEYEKKIFKELDAVVDGIAVMTDGPRGALISDGHHIYQSEIFEGNVIDRTGAGDAFGSGFVAGLMRKLGKPIDNWHLAIEYAIRLGSANATSVIENVGANNGTITQNEFERSPRWQYIKMKIFPV